MNDVKILSTGSDGNCIIIDESIMIDAGISKKKMITLGYNLDHLKVLLITHKHGDHLNLPFVRWAIQNDIEVYISADTKDKINQEGKLNVDDYLNDNVHIHQSNKPFTVEVPTAYDENDEPLDIKKITITAHPQKHYDLTNYAFVVEDGKRLLYSTDLDTLEPSDYGDGLLHLGMFDTIILEGNYDEIWLRDYINMSIAIIDRDKDASQMTDTELDQWVRTNYQVLPKAVSGGLFRAVQNMRHLSKQQARIYVGQHLLPNGKYYEVHRSSMFYERPTDWSLAESEEW